MFNKGAGYTAFINAFCIFVCDQEVKVDKSPVLKEFKTIASVKSFENLKLPILKKTEATDNNKVNVAYEIDLSQRKAIKRALGLAKFDCFPLLWVFSTPLEKTWTVEF